jgi:hypothetical protein
MSAATHCEDPLIAAAPSPTSAGVFGIARTTAAVEPAAACNVDNEMPAAIDSTRVAPARASAAHVSAAAGGLTAITPAVHATIFSEVTTPGYNETSCARLSLDVSTTVINDAGQPAFNNPATSAAPILPPPTNVMGV